MFCCYLALSFSGIVELLRRSRPFFFGSLPSRFKVDPWLTFVAFDRDSIGRLRQRHLSNCANNASDITASAHYSHYIFPPQPALPNPRCRQNGLANSRFFSELSELLPAYASARQNEHPVYPSMRHRGCGARALERIEKKKKKTGTERRTSKTSQTSKYWS